MQKNSIWRTIKTKLLGESYTLQEGETPELLVEQAAAIKDDNEFVEFVGKVCKNGTVNSCLNKHPELFLRLKKIRDGR